MNERCYDYMDWPRIEAVVYAEEASPRDVMGPRITPDGVLIQGYFPEADDAQVMIGNQTYPMEQEDEAGYFAAMIRGRKIPEYRFAVRWGETEAEFSDPYAYPCQITEEEERAFCAGVSYHAYEILGAHPMTIDKTEGTLFAVWAPNAMRVSVVGDFNNWDGRCHMMHRMPMSGIFELFIPGVKTGTAYKYEIRTKTGEIRRKADPYAAAAGVPAGDHSVVADLGSIYDETSWHDDVWMKKRKIYADRRQPISIYETDITEWENGEKLIAFVKDMGYTHVELRPVMEYLDEQAGPYSTFGYFAPTARFGTAEEFQKLVDGLHQADIGVILDWTPAQFPRVEAGLELFDGTPLYEVQNPAESVHPKWGTMLYNYGSPMVRDFLISNAFYWMELFHADGLRMDDVDAMLYLDYGRGPGEWTPNLYGTNENLSAMEFLKHLNSIVKKKLPGVVLIAQEDGLWPELTDSVENDHLGFDYKWNSSWTQDLLRYLSVDPIERRYYHDDLTLSMLYAYCEHYVLALGSRDVGNLSSFMERLPGNESQKLAQVREAYAYQVLHPGCVMNAPDRDMPETLKTYLRDLNAVYKTHPALYEKDNEYDGFEWVQLMKYEENVIVFERKTDRPEETLLAVCNFAAVPYEAYQIGVPFYGKYKEIFNSDQKAYGGNGTVNPRVKTGKPEACDERNYSITLKIPALGTVILSCTPVEEPKVRKKTEIIAETKPIKAPAPKAKASRKK